MPDIIDLLNNLNIDDYNASSDKYQNDNHISVPRVTEILSRMIHSDTLMYWANSLGFKRLKYRDVLNKAASIGTEAHNAIEKFLKDKLKTEDNVPFLGFLNWYTDLSTSGVQVEAIYIEKTLICEWFGGTLDALLKIDGKTYLVDFKTSNHVTFTYFLQLAAYNFMLKKIGVHIDGVLVLQLNKNYPSYTEYILDFSVYDHITFFINCEQTFLSLVYSYYHIYNVEKNFDVLFKETNKYGNTA